MVGEDYFLALAQDIAELSRGEPVDIVGFSIGAFVALQVCRILAHKVRCLHLISPAAPLGGGDFLGAMAGKVVFRLARRAPLLFKLLSAWQGILASHFPKVLFDMLFASAVAGDKALARNPAFRQLMANVLSDCFYGHAGGYLRDVRAYVSPWQDSLKEVTVTTQLWHGDQDNWAPLAMTNYLSQQIPGCTTVTRMEGHSHYSTLYSAAPQICRQLGKIPSASRQIQAVALVE